MKHKTAEAAQIGDVGRNFVNASALSRFLQRITSLVASNNWTPFPTNLGPRCKLTCLLPHVSHSRGSQRPKR
uniref:Uncharacterized protein n=1 Tax=Setaria viridis TaxID=4556 RepID=A0A4U6VFM5_SETVI|nr:hypothetical protein SEVIR_4G260400v2 [Setaria viridis]